MRDIKERLSELRETVAASKTPAQYETRKKILDRIIEHLEDSGNDKRHFYANLIRDWPCFVAWELDTREGVPIFYSPWQLDAYYRSLEYDNVWLSCCRQSGKTVFEATKALELCLKNENHKVMIVAPTKTQLVARDEFRHFVNNSEFIQEHFLKEDLGGVNAKFEMYFAGNGSRFQALNLSGDFKRGETANTIMIDEFQLLSSKDYNEVVQPMLSSTFTNRQIYRFMTPSWLYREDLGDLWWRAQDSGDILTINIDIWQALHEGIKKATYDDGAGSVQEIFDNLNIDCPYVAAVGACPDMLPAWFQEDPETGEKPSCGCAALRNDSFLKEHMARFPKQSEKYFPAEWLHSARKKKQMMSVAEIAALDDPLVLGIDLGGLSDPTEIVINRYREKNNTFYLETLRRHQYNPVGGGGSGSKADLKSIGERIKRLYHKLAGQVTVIPDITRKEHQAQDLTSGANKIPPSAIATNDTADRHGLSGIWITGQEKSRLYNNHRILLGQSQVEVRGSKDSFWDDYFHQHNAVREDQSGRASYTKFQMPTEDHLVDAAVMGSAITLFSSGAPPSYHFEMVPRNLE